ncbi:MAG: 3',5'-cyclic adenosine monophosphate phosphodiesterase CpdA [Candidatus Thorarchaeota archaeon AB_25]|nr:MAG: 3',5'-cyclic adenosine monophosphate phosphodiesterase CpdA [Candidatus Thorarchaeota archaeon AB_25]
MRFSFDSRFTSDCGRDIILTLFSGITRLKCCILDGKPVMETIFDDRGMIITHHDTSVLLISDIHLGFEEELAESRGVQFPPQHPVILERIERLVKRHNISHLFIIGDVKHTILTDRYYNWEIIPEFMKTLANQVKTTVIPGNHDGDLRALLPRDIIVTDVHGILIGPKYEQVGLLHGHSWPSADILDAKMIVIGHNHPTIRRFRDASVPEIGRSSRRRYAGTVPVVLKTKLNRNCVRSAMGMLEVPEDSGCILITLPSFNELLSGISVNYPMSEFHGPFFENMCARLSESEVHSTNGIYLGSIEWFRQRFNEMIKSKSTGD